MMDMMNLVAGELAHSGEASTMTPLTLELEAHRITSTTELRPMEFLFTLFGKPCFPRRELVAFTGRAKSGKTLVTSMLMALCVVDEVLAFKRNGEAPDGGLRLLWFDTEQSDNSTQDILKNRIMPLYWRAKGREEPFPEEMLDIFNVRNVNRDRREELLLAAIAGYKPDLVILDGIRDLVGDINDGEVAQELIERLMTTARRMTPPSEAPRSYWRHPLGGCRKYEREGASATPPFLNISLTNNTNVSIRSQTKCIVWKFSLSKRRWQRFIAPRSTAILPP